MSRQLRRLALRDLRTHGCNCCPDIRFLPAAVARRNGAASGATVRHEAGCPLGDRLIPLNNAGTLPALIHITGRCSR